MMSKLDSIKIWQLNTDIHSSSSISIDNYHDNTTSNYDYIDSKHKITALDYYFDQFCHLNLVWFDGEHQSLYTGLLTDHYELININVINYNLNCSHARIAADRFHRKIYIALYEFGTIDYVDINRNFSYLNLIKNLTRPNEIAVDGDENVLFWIENWSCIAQISIDNKANVMKKCQIKPRTIATDTLSKLLYWCDFDGLIYFSKYFQYDFKFIKPTKKIHQVYAIEIIQNSIYLSDSFKLYEVERTTSQPSNVKVVFVETGVFDFKIIKPEHKICYDDAHVKYENKSQSVKFHVNSNSSLYQVDVYQLENDGMILYHFVPLLYLILLILILAPIIFYLLRRKLRNQQRNNENRRLLIRKNYQRFRDKNLTSKSRVLCIEDLSGIRNNAFIRNNEFQESDCSNCPLRQTCDNCIDRNECIESGICLSTFRLLEP